MGHRPLCENVSVVLSFLLCNFIDTVSLGSNSRPQPINRNEMMKYAHKKKIVSLSPIMAQRKEIYRILANVSLLIGSIEEKCFLF